MTLTENQMAVPTQWCDDPAELKKNNLSNLGYMVDILDTCCTCWEHASCKMNQLNKENAKGEGDRDFIAIPIINPRSYQKHYIIVRPKQSFYALLFVRSMFCKGRA